MKYCFSDKSSPVPKLLKKCKDNISSLQFDNFVVSKETTGYQRQNLFGTFLLLSNWKYFFCTRHVKGYGFYAISILWEAQSVTTWTCLQAALYSAFCMTKYLLHKLCAALGIKNLVLRSFYGASARAARYRKSRVCIHAGSEQRFPCVYRSYSSGQVLLYNILLIPLHWIGGLVVTCHECSAHGLWRSIVF